MELEEEEQEKEETDGDKAAIFHEVYIKVGKEVEKDNNED